MQRVDQVQHIHGWKSLCKPVMCPVRKARYHDLQYRLIIGLIELALLIELVFFTYYCCFSIIMFIFAEFG